jgi:DNA-directed RNA polymerase subunit RPC12/RpoP
VTTTNQQSGLYAARLFVVMVALVGLPFLPVVFADSIPERFRWLMLLWLPLGFFLWARLARRLLMKASYKCPQCNQQQARMDVTEGTGEVFLACRSCGFREKSKVVAWGDGSLEPLSPANSPARPEVPPTKH